MKLDELYLDGFGHFHQQTIGPFTENITVLYGPNEAGKSTLLAFVRATLFGFPSRFKQYYPPPAGRRHGGRVTLTSDAGLTYTVERFAGARGGLSVATPSSPASNAETLLRRLTGSATSDLFRNVFAFSLDELQAASSLNDSNGTIYSAGKGAPGLPALSRSLSDHKGKIYLPRGNNQEVPRLVNSLRDIEAQLISIEGNAGRFGELTARKSAIDSDLPSADAEVAGLNTRHAEIDRLLRGWDDWVALSDCEARLQEAPSYPDFPENAISRIENLEAQIEQARESLGEAAEQLRRAKETASTEVPGQDLLYDRARIETIRRSRQSFDDSIKDLPERRAELNALESELNDRLRDLGQDWDEERLQKFDVSMTFRQEVERGRDTLTQPQHAVRRAEQRLEQEQRLLEECQTAAGEAQERIPANAAQLNAAGLGQQREALRAARGRLTEYERHRQNHDNLRGQLNTLTAGQKPAESGARTSLALAGLLAAAGAVLIVAGVLLGSAAMLMGLIGGLGLLGAAAFLVLRSRTATPVVNPLTGSLSRQSAEAETSADSAWQRLVEAASPLAIAEDLNAAALETAEVRLDAAQAAFAVWDDAKGRAQEAQRRLRAQEQRGEQAALLLKNASSHDAEARREWQGWLDQHSLPDSFTPDTVVEFMGRVETARVKAEQVRDNRRRVAAIQDDIRHFREQLEPLAERHGLPLAPENPRQLASVADGLIQCLDEAQKAFTDRERAKDQMEESRILLETRERRLRSAENILSALLAAANTDDAEEFRRRARLHEERLDLERQQAEHRRSLERLSGPGEKFDTFRESLANSDPKLLAEESAVLLEQHAEVDSRRNALREERGAIDNELGQLTGEEESSELRARRAILQERLREQAWEWSRLTIAESLLEKTRQKFERERQPSVIRHAQDFFYGVTGQRYNRLYAPIGEQTITVTDSTGATKQPGELSRGTREQLYLALRFGLIREFGEHAERLPVVVDEALVNFDPERATHAAQAFAELAETNQVLVFTCHPATADMFSNVGAQRVDIGPVPY